MSELLSDSTLGAIEAGVPPDAIEEVTFACADCGEEHDHEDSAEQCCWPGCQSCGERFEYQEDAEHCCMFECRNCGDWHEYESEADTCCMYSCGSCGEYHEYQEDAHNCCRGGDPYYPTLAAVTPHPITVAALSNRPPRWISIEQELTAGGAAVAAMLSDHGLSESSYVEEYNYQPSIGSIAVCEDGSLPSGGGEVKYSRFDLSDSLDSERLSEAVAKIRQLHKDAGIVSVSSAAGMHIHASAKDRAGRVLEPVGMTALHELFSHGEDMIYGLATAGWAQHRYGRGGNDYAKPIPKVSGKTPWKVARVMGNKYYGINFERLLNTVNRCSCGSVRFGAWSECECGAFDKATVEWRVFNTSTMPETIHAWVLFVSGVMALAQTHEVGTLPDQPFDLNFATAQSRMTQRWTTLEWFLNTAPFTWEERDVIRAAADRSPLMTKPQS